MFDSEIIHHVIYKHYIGKWWVRILKLNILFLLIGLSLTILSKVLQFVYKSKIGDLLVIPAAIFFVLAVLFSIRKYTDLLNKENGIQEVTIIATAACLAIVSFQVMTILLFGNNNKLGFVFLVPCILSVGIFIYKWGTL